MQVCILEVAPLCCCVEKGVFGIEEDALWMWWYSSYVSCFCWSVSYLLPVVRRHVLQTLTKVDIL